VCDGTGKPSDRRQLLRLQQHILRPLPVGNINSENDDAGDTVVGLAQRLIDEIDVTLIWLYAFPSIRIITRTASDIRFALIDPIQNVDIPLFGRVGECHPHRFSNNIAVIHQAQIKRVGDTDNVVRTLQQGEEHLRVVSGEVLEGQDDDRAQALFPRGVVPSCRGVECPAEGGRQDNGGDNQGSLSLYAFLGEWGGKARSSHLMLLVYLQPGTDR